MKGLVVDAHHGRVVLEDHVDPLEGDDHIVRPGSRLLSTCCPTAVPGFVVPVRVDSVNRVTYRRGPHVLYKRCRIVRPTLAHGYPAPTILRILRIVWVEASALGVVVGLQFTTLPSANAVPVRQRARRCQFFLKTPATPDCAAPNGIQLDCLLTAALAEKAPIGMSPRDVGAANCREAPVLLARNVEWFHAQHYAPIGDTRKDHGNYVRFAD